MKISDREGNGSTESSKRNLIMRAEKVLDEGTWLRLGSSRVETVVRFQASTTLHLRPSDFWVVTLHNSLQEQRPRTLKLLHLGGGRLSAANVHVCP